MQKGKYNKTLHQKGSDHLYNNEEHSVVSDNQKLKFESQPPAVGRHVGQ